VRTLRGVGVRMTGATCAAAAVALTVGACSSAPPRTAAEFCRVLTQQKHQHLHDCYHPGNKSGLGQLFYAALRTVFWSGGQGRHA
jgi:hypothetical protein